MIFDGGIDAHVHLWDPARGDDILILAKEPSLGPLGRAEELRAHLRACGATGAILVQSAPNSGHSDWLRAAAREIGAPLGVVGWIDPTGPDSEQRIADLIFDPNVCGVRLMLNRMPAPSILRDRAMLDGLSQLAQAGLALECLAPPGRLSQVATLARALPEAQIVLDHCGLPPAPPADLTPWQRGLQDLAELQNVSVKLSGLMEPFGPTAEPTQIYERATFCLNVFGPKRLMAASNHPCNAIAGGTMRWADGLELVVNRAGLGAADRTALFSGTALRVFGRLGDIITKQGETIGTFQR